MDVVRAPRRFRVPGLSIVLSACGVAVAIAASYSAFLHPVVHEPVVDRESIVTDVARRGAIIRGVSAPGTIVSGHTDVVSAPADGTISQILVRPGTEVRIGTPIVSMRSPSLETAVASATAQLAAAKAERESIEAQNQSAILESEVDTRSARADRDMDRTQNGADKGLFAAGLISGVTYHIGTIRATEAADRLHLDESRTLVAQANGRARLAEQDAKIADLESMLAARRADVSSLNVNALSDGTVQNVSVAPGQRITAGTEIARLASRNDLIARLAISEDDARLVSAGQRVSVNVAGIRKDGHVMRLAPVASNGTISADVSLSSPPPGLRIDSHIDGVVELERLTNVVSILRPAGAADGSTLKLYRLTGRDRANLIVVHLGAGTIDRVAVRGGLKVGDVVIVSDMTSTDDAPVIELR